MWVAFLAAPVHVPSPLSMRGHFPFPNLAFSARVAFPGSMLYRQFPHFPPFAMALFPFFPFLSAYCRGIALFKKHRPNSL